MVQVRPAGNVSVKLTPVAFPAPMLLSVTSKPMSSPAETGPIGLATFCTLTSGQFTVMVTAPEELLPVAPAASLVAAVVAVFETVPQVADVVGEKMCTTLLVPGARLPKAQLKLVVSVHAPASAPSLLQLRPLFVGNVSLRVTPVPVPVPAALELLTVMV